ATDDVLPIQPQSAIWAPHRHLRHVHPSLPVLAGGGDAEFAGKDPGFVVLRVSLQYLTDTRRMYIGVPLYREHEVLVRLMAVPAAAIMWCIQPLVGQALRHRIQPPWAA